MAEAGVETRSRNKFFCHKCSVEINPNLPVGTKSKYVFYWLFSVTDSHSLRPVTSVIYRFVINVVPIYRKMTTLFNNVDIDVLFNSPNSAENMQSVVFCSNCNLFSIHRRFRLNVLFIFYVIMFRFIVQIRPVVPTMFITGKQLLSVKT